MVDIVVEIVLNVSNATNCTFNIDCRLTSYQILGIPSAICYKAIYECNSSLLVSLSRGWTIYLYLLNSDHMADLLWFTLITCEINVQQFSKKSI